jgi:FkbM family methyltransferase
LQWIVETLKTINGNIVHLDARLTALESGLTKKLLDAQCVQTFGLPSLPAPEPEQAGNPPRFIVTLTSHGNRIGSTAPNAIWSIFQQSVLPDRIILWLAHGETIPPKLQMLQAHGLEIRFCDDIGPYARLIPALREFPNDVLITADDDVHYPQNWFASLKAACRREPDKIWCHRAVEATDNGKTILPVQAWKKSSANAATPQGRLIPLSAGGVLFPPDALPPLAEDASKFLSLAPHCDDFWYWAMGRVQGTLAAVLPGSADTCPTLPDVPPLADDEFWALLREFPHIFGWLEPAHVKMKLDLTDYIQRLIFFNACPDKAELVPLLDVFPQDGVFVDLGANVGVYALNFAKKSSTVIAVEATQETHALLAETIRDNQIGNIRLYFNAIDRENGRELAIYPGVMGKGNIGGNSVYREQADFTPANTVTTITLDSIVTDNGIERLDLIKIDIEGGEMNALRGGEDSISRFRPFIFCELNPVSSVRAGYSTTDLFNYFTRNLRYSPFRISENQFIPVTEFTKYRDSLINLLFIPTEKMTALQGTPREVAPVGEPAPENQAEPQAAVSVVAGDGDLADFDGLTSRTIFCLWTGKEAMSENRIQCLWSLYNNTGCPVALVNENTVANWINESHPLHPAYPYLSSTHKADYLRCYLMHHYGGGYTDIKMTTKAWGAFFQGLQASEQWALGYTELENGMPHLVGEQGELMRRNYADLIGMCAFIFRKQTPLTHEWMRQVNAVLDARLEALRAHPATHPMDQSGVILPDGQKSPYPLRWAELLGEILHPLLWQFRDKLLHAPIEPLFGYPYR